MDNPSLFSRAINDFHEARRKARLENLLLTFSGKPKDLLSYDEVRHKLRATEGSFRRLQEIPIDAIVGSVNRYTDFSRSFLPRQESDRERWARVKLGVNGMAGLPPIEAYRLGDVYFVLDGHHRVSVAREIGAKTIEGYVVPVYTRVAPSPTDRPDDIIIKAEYVEFLSRTGIDELRPGAYLLVTAPGQYPKLEEHIAVHRYFMGQRLDREVSMKEAVTDWYDSVYQPMTQMIRELDLLRDFPHRNETDLYIWIMDYRNALGGGEIGWEVPADRAAVQFSHRFSPQRRLPRLANRVANLLVPDPFTSGPPPGQWRSEHPSSPHRVDHLFDDMLVTVPGSISGPRQAGWSAVQMALEVARREDARLTGLHVLPPGSPKDGEVEEGIRAEFVRRCEESGVQGRLIVEEAADIAPLICRRSLWVDLVVFRMNYPPPSQPIQRLRSGARLMIRMCNSPLLAVPDSAFNLDGALLAYGPGRKADEALFVATYLAGAWKIPLTVLAVKNEKTTASPTPLERARAYLQEHGIQAAYIEESGDPASAVVLTAESRQAGLLIMGGYESSPVRESVFGSTVDRVLRSTRRPVLICR